VVKGGRRLITPEGAVGLAGAQFRRAATSPVRQRRVLAAPGAIFGADLPCSLETKLQRNNSQVLEVAGCRMAAMLNVTVILTSVEWMKLQEAAAKQFSQ
jgi:hypothetical protein